MDYQHQNAITDLVLMLRYVQVHSCHVVSVQTAELCGCCFEVFCNFASSYISKMWHRPQDPRTVVCGKSSSFV